MITKFFILERNVCNSGFTVRLSPNLSLARLNLLVKNCLTQPIRTYLVVFKCLCNGDDIVGLVVPGHAANQADGELVVLTVELQLLLMLLAHIHTQARPVPGGGGQAAHAGPRLPLLRLLQRTPWVPPGYPRGRVHAPGSAHTVHHVAQQRVGSQSPAARLSTLWATRQLVGLDFPALKDAHLAEVVSALEDDRVPEQLQTHRAGKLTLQLLNCDIRHSLLWT